MDWGSAAVHVGEVIAGVLTGVAADRKITQHRQAKASADDDLGVGKLEDRVTKLEPRVTALEIAQARLIDHDEQGALDRQRVLDVLTSVQTAVGTLSTAVARIEGRLSRRRDDANRDSDG